MPYSPQKGDFLTMNCINSEYTRFTRTLVEDLTSRLHSAYCREDALADYDRLTRAVTSSGVTSAYEHLKWELVKKLNASGISCGRDATLEALKELVYQMPDRDTLEAELYEELYQVCQQFPTASDFMARLVDRLADADLKCDSVRLTIVRQFVRYTNYGTLAVKKLVIPLVQKEHPEVDTAAFDREDVIRWADERIFDVLDQPMTRDERRTYALIRLADDLAGGKFRMGGKTKTDLYMFAFAFQMTVYTGGPDEKMDPDRDLEKNLFRDFYNDNLLRYASRDFQNNVTAYEQEPSGEGINYKNFAEVIYLYYLKQPKLSPRKRLTDANAQIEKCVKRVKAQPPVSRSAESGEGQYTQYYHDQFLRQVCALSPGELTDFICENYAFPEDIDKMANISAESQRRTAAKVYDELLAQVLDMVDEEELQDMSYGLDLTMAMSNYEEDSPFAVLMEKLDQMLTIQWTSYPVSGTPAEEKLTRTHLIALFAYYYQLKGWAKGLTMPKLLKNFRTMIDPLLSESRFQSISEKNIFDMFTIIAVYHLQNQI